MVSSSSRYWERLREYKLLIAVYAWTVCLCQIKQETQTVFGKFDTALNPENQEKIIVSPLNSADFLRLMPWLGEQKYHIVKFALSRWPGHYILWRKVVWSRLALTPLISIHRTINLSLIIVATNYSHIYSHLNTDSTDFNTASRLLSAIKGEELVGLLNPYFSSKSGFSDFEIVLWLILRIERKEIFRLYSGQSFDFLLHI